MANDFYHDAVKEALIKDGWVITQEPYYLEIDDDITYQVDISAEKWIIAEKAQDFIIVEVKSFLKASKVYEFHSAIGQYLVYQAALDYNSDYGRLLLAVPSEIYNKFFTKPFIQFVLKKYSIDILQFDTNTKKLI